MLGLTGVQPTTKLLMEAPEDEGEPPSSSDAPVVTSAPRPVFLVEWYRPDPRGRIYRIWGLGVILVLMGVTCATLALVAGRALGAELHAVLALIGATCTVAGPLSSVIRLLREMRFETVLSLQSNGLILTVDGQATFVTWTALQPVEVLVTEQTESLILNRAGAAPIEVRQQFNDVTLQALARRINHVRTKALMGMLRPTVRPGTPYLKS